jgi:alpha-1,2-mannosyltransferase
MFVTVIAVAWHVLATLAPAWVQVGAKPSRGRDFASYYYAVRVAAEGGDPYVRGELGGAARAEGARLGVHPFLYPPPFLLLMVWAIPLDLITAYRTWFWLDELWAVAAVLALWRWWRPMGPYVGATLAVAIAAFTAVPANHVMGQANFPGLALAMVGLWQADKGRWHLGGLLMGAACMVKMSPALFVGWWLLHGKWKSALAACVAALLLSIAALPILDVEGQLAFYTRVLPTFGSGDYNGLTVPISMFGNHSIPNLWNQVLPGVGRTLSASGQTLSTVSTLVMLGVLGARFRRQSPDLLARANQIGAISIALLLVPVYTYEHHCVWAIPAVVAAVMAVLEGRLDVRWAAPLGIAIVVWSFEILDLRRIYVTIAFIKPLAWLVQEAKFGALFTLLVATTVAGGRYDAPASGRPLAP